MANGSSMTSGPLATLFRVGTLAGLSDVELLDRFRLGPAEDSEAAFAAIVERHGAMVLEVCRRIVGDRHDAEDAAQATFLVLARRAGSIRRGDSLSSWLYGTAARLAGRSRRETIRRRTRERKGAEVRASRWDEGQPAAVSGEDAWPELYEELGRLPDRFRLPVMFCYLEGLSYEQAADRLGCPVRTVQSRLARARDRLRAAMIRRGLEPVAPASVLVSMHRLDVSRAAVPAAWKHAMIAAAARIAAGGPVAGLVSHAAIRLLEGEFRIMLIRSVAGILAMLSMASAVGGVMVVAGPSARPEAPKPAAARPDVPDEPRYRVRFRGGATVEVIGVSTFPTGPQTWWRPDGTPMDEAPIDRIISRPIVGTHQPKARVIVVRALGIGQPDMIRWHPIGSSGYWGSRPRKDRRNALELDYYVAEFDQSSAECGVQVRVASGPWKTEVSHDGGGGFGTFVNGHKFCFGKARAAFSDGRPITAIAVSHNFLGMDRRLLAIDRDGGTHPGYSAMGSDGDPRWVVDLIDAEFHLPPEVIQEYQVQFRPYEEKTIAGIALDPRPAGR